MFEMANYIQKLSFSCMKRKYAPQYAICTIHSKKVTDFKKGDKEKRRKRSVDFGDIFSISVLM